jgi:hypothetical protein
MSSVEFRYPLLDELTDQTGAINLINLRAPVVGEAIQMDFLGHPDYYATLAVDPSQGVIELWRADSLPLAVETACRADRQPIFVEPLVGGLVCRRLSMSIWTIEAAASTETIAGCRPGALRYFVARIAVAALAANASSRRFEA